MSIVCMEVISHTPLAAHLFLVQMIIVPLRFHAVRIIFGVAVIHAVTMVIMQTAIHATLVTRVMEVMVVLNVPLVNVAPQRWREILSPF